MDRISTTHMEEYKCSVYRILLGKTEERKELGRTRRRWMIILKRIIEK